MVTTYEIVTAPSGWKWVKMPNGELYRSKKTGEIAAFPTKKAANVLIKSLEGPRP